jgi:DNA-binding CsgD family transcriptional regulator
MSEQSNQDRRTRGKSITIQVEQRRKKVAELLSIGMSESAIARQLGKARSTINEDVSAMKSQAVDFVYQLVRSDICYFYQGTFNTLKQVKAKAMEIYSNNKNKPNIQLKALDTVIRCELASFDMLQQGPTVTAVRGLSERLERLEQQKAEPKATPIQQQEVSAS